MYIYIYIYMHVMRLTQYLGLTRKPFSFSDPVVV